MTNQTTELSIRTSDTRLAMVAMKMDKPVVTTTMMGNRKKAAR